MQNRGFDEPPQSLRKSRRGSFEPLWQPLSLRLGPWDSEQSQSHCSRWACGLELARLPGHRENQRLSWRQTEFPARRASPDEDARSREGSGRLDCLVAGEGFEPPTSGL